MFQESQSADKSSHRVNFSIPSRSPGEDYSADWIRRLDSFYARVRGKELADFLGIRECRSLLVLGCGASASAFQLAIHNPDLDLYLADHQIVLETSKEMATRCRLRNRIHYVPLDVLKDPIPGSYDLILVSNVLHGIGEQASRKLIRRLYDSIDPGGSLAIQIRDLHDDGLGVRGPVFPDLIQVTGHRRNNSACETRQWLEDAGFKNIEFKAMTRSDTNSYLRGDKQPVENITQTGCAEGCAGRSEEKIMRHCGPKYQYRMGYQL